MLFFNIFPLTAFPPFYIILAFYCLQFNKTLGSYHYEQTIFVNVM